MEYDVSKTTYYRKIKEIFCLLGVTSIKPAKNNYNNKYLKESTFKVVIAMMIMSKRGANHKLLPDEEILHVAAAEMNVMSSKVKRLV